MTRAHFRSCVIDADGNPASIVARIKRRYIRDGVTGKPAGIAGYDFCELGNLSVVFEKSVSGEALTLGGAAESHVGGAGCWGVGWKHCQGRCLWNH